MVAEWFARVNIGDVQFDQGDSRTLDRIMQRNTGVCIGPCVDHDTGKLALGVQSARLVNPIDELALVIGLPELQFEAMRRAGLLAQGFDIGQRL